MIFIVLWYFLCMSKDKSIFVCSNCGNEYAAWQGKCDACNEWNSLRELKMKNEKLKTRQQAVPVEISTLAGANIARTRLSTKIGEVDRVLGGGIVPGSVILLAGDPGIGKSTLLMRLVDNIEHTLYVSGEESRDQVGLRAYRMGVGVEEIDFLAESNVDNIINILQSNPQPSPYQLIIIDSIQTMYSSDFPSTPGSLVQVRECALRLQQFAKSSGIAIILVGHVTKDGTVAGPKTLEHLVDVVLQLEGERYHDARILRGLKNRFGATEEIGLFAMSEAGLQEVVNPSELFLKERVAGAPGSVVTVIIEGSRPLLVEAQALTVKTPFGYPKRSATGFDINRLNLITATLQQRAGVKLYDQDIYVNVVGGVTIKEPAGDLAIALAIVSAFTNKPIDPQLCAFGEVGLSGEIRSVRMLDRRAAEAKRLGFKPIGASKNLKAMIEAVL